jgi:hypothetical protein
MSKKKPPDPKKPGAIVPDVLRNAVLARLADEEGQMTLPVLFSCLVPQYDGMTLLRPAGKLSITVEGCYWRLQLDMPYERLTCRMFGASLSTALSDMNAYLGTGTAVMAPMFERSKKPLPRLDAPIE